MSTLKLLALMRGHKETLLHFKESQAQKIGNLRSVPYYSMKHHGKASEDVLFYKTWCTDKSHGLYPSEEASYCSLISAPMNELWVLSVAEAA